MNLNSLFESAIDQLEQRRIEDLESRMDDLARRAKQSQDPRVVAALRQEFARAKAERDSYHHVNEAPGAETLSHNQNTVADNENALDLEEHGGGGGGPAEWHAYVRSHRADEAANPAQQAAIAIAKKKEVNEADRDIESTIRTLMAPAYVDGSGGNFSYELERRAPTMDALRTKYQDDLNAILTQTPPRVLAQAAAELKDWLKPVEEGFQDFNKVEPYAVCLAGKPVKKFDYYEEARRFHDNWKQKLYREGNKEKADKITLMPLNLDEESMADASHNPTGAKFGGYYKGTQVGAPRPGQSFGAESKETKVPAPRNFVAKNMKSGGAGQHKDAKRAAKQGDVKHKAQAVSMDEGVNFMEWAVSQGARFANFTNSPAVYAQAKEAYVAEGMSNALSNITRRMAQPVNAKTVIKNREQKKKTLKTQNFAEDEDQLDEIKKGQKDSNGNTSCWSGYHAAGTKKSATTGKQVRNCVPNESIEESEAWQKANKKDKTDGMSKKAVNAYRRENPGSKLKTAVTTKPSKLKKGSKSSKRRSSYCARSKGQKDMHNIDCSKTPDKAICKARSRWNCESQEQFDAMLREAVDQSKLKPGQYYIWTVYFDDGTNTRVKVTRDTFDPKAYYAKQNRAVVNVDYSWDPHNG